MKTVAVCQARMGSTRLPGKVLQDICGRPTLAWVVEAARRAPGVDEVIVATSTLPGDDAIYQWCLKHGVSCFRGSETDVLSRFLGAADATGADIIIRLTSDCPFLDPSVIGEVVKLREINDNDYATNTDPPSYPDGLDVEVFTRAALEAASSEATRLSDRDTVTRFLVRNRSRFSAGNLVCPLPGLVNERWVLDSPEDLDLVREIAKRLGERTPPSYLQILSILDREPHLRKLNSKYTRNERFYEGLAQEKGVKRSFTQSKIALARAESLIPLGAQTFSKSKLQFPVDGAPLFVTHGDGGYVFDVDGNDYVDLVGALLPNILGYRDPGVDWAIRNQLNRGISFSLATEAEAELAERLHQYIPSAEMVRYGKNGSDVTTAAVRLARHITGKDKVWVGGYHGWHDWSMAITDRANGIPHRIGDLSYKMPWNRDDGTGHDEFAAVIIEPEFFTQGQLQDLREHCNHYGSILIFDEIISGFRCGMGGLQKVYGVTPDLSTFGKSMANGMPISALVGLERYMKRMPEIAYSGTFFGEALSIAAAIATIDKLADEDVPGKLEVMGREIRGTFLELCKKHSITSIQMSGPLALNRLTFSYKAIQSVFISEMAQQGVLIIGSNNICAAHGEPELKRILQAYDHTLGVIRDKTADGSIGYASQILGKAVR